MAKSHTKTTANGRRSKMPSPITCYNRVDITGPETMLNNFITAYNVDVLRRMWYFDKVCAAPKLSNLTNKNFAAEFELVFWGTKQPEQTMRLRKNSKHVAYTFDTEWQPPIAMLKEASRQHPTLQFTLNYFYCATENSVTEEQICFLNGSIVDERRGVCSDTAIEYNTNKYSTAANVGILNRELDDYIMRTWQQLGGNDDTRTHLQQTKTVTATKAWREYIAKYGTTILRDQPHLVMATNDFWAMLDYIEHPKTTAKNVWELLAYASKQVGGGVAVHACIQSKSDIKRAIGKLFLQLAPLLTPGRMGVFKESREFTFTHKNEADTLLVHDKAYKILCAAAAGGYLEDWSNGVAVLAAEWYGKNIVGLLETAQHLVAGDVRPKNFAACHHNV